MHVYGRANSSNVMKVIWLLERLGLAYERIDIGGVFGGTNSEAHRAMNPNGTVPTLDDNGFILWESNAILRYICDAHASGVSLWPQDVRARADIDRWLDWQQTVIHEPQRILLRNFFRLPPEKRDAIAVDRAIAALVPAWRLLEAQLRNRDFVGWAPNLTLADIALGVHVHRWFAFDIERPPMPALHDWYARLLEMPEYCQHVAQPLG